ncbi:peptide ABC transporter substrate-binding protein [Solibaculum mannosilyticum]|uniref:peptide ABC transporter substrate-binding protein n=1 Tax=Solibaculum mannosilyticum TaxID=2780922 RepID=UPI0034B536BD
MPYAPAQSAHRILQGCWIRRLLCLFCVCSLLLSASSCSKDSPAGKLINYVLEGEPAQLDPQFASSYSARIVLMNCMEGLTRIDSQGQVIPGAAARWDVSSDQKTWTFYLRQDAYWVANDGSQVAPVTASDFVFGMQRAVDPATQSPIASELYPVEGAQDIHERGESVDTLGATALDDFTLEIRLSYPVSDLPRRISSGPWLPCNEEFFLSTGGSYGLEKDMLLYNGPFRMMQWEHDVSLRLKANSKYRGHNAVQPSGVLFQIIKDSDEVQKALTESDLDAAPVTSKQFESLEDKGFQEVFFEDTTWALCFNQDEEMWQNESIRKALGGSVERDLLYNTMPGHMSATYGLVLSSALAGDQSYRSAPLEASPLVLDKEARVLYSQGVSTLSSDEEISIDVLCPDDMDIQLAMGFMQQSWQKNIGVYVNLVPLSESELARRIQNGNYQVALCALRGDDDQAISILELFESDNDKNPVQLKSSQYDALLSTARQKGGTDVASLQACEEYLLEHAVVVPIYAQKRIFAMAENISGILFHPFDEGVDFIGAGKLD